MSRILDKSFRYVPAAHSDIRKTFKRIIGEQKRAAEQAKADEAERAAVVAKRRIK